MGFVATAVRRWQITLVAFLLLAMLGFNAFRAIPRAVDPYFPIPLTVVIVTLPGADAAEIEETVAKPLERVLQGLDNVRDITSRSSDGLASISIWFDYGTDAEQSYDRTVRDVNALRAQLPAGIQRLEIRRPRTTEAAISQIALVSDTASWRRMEKYAEDLRDRLAGLDGVRNTELYGLPAPEVRIALDPARLAERRLPPGLVATAIAQGGLDVPAGAVNAGNRRFNVQSGGAYRSLDAIRAIPLRGGDGQLLTVGDVANVEWAEAERLHITRLNGQRAVFVGVRKKDMTDTLVLRDRLKTVKDQFQQELPPDIKLVPVFDQSNDIERKLNQLAKDFGIALVLVLVTLLPLGPRASLVVMLSIPTSLAIGLTGLNILGYSLNQLTVSGFIVALGLLVDDSIVVTENIERHIRMGKNRVTAAIEGTKEITLAVMGSTGVLIFAFLPLANLPETAGDFTRSLPMAVLLTVAASLLVSMSLVPFAASRILATHQSHEGNRFLRWVTERIEHWYRPALHWSLANPHKTVWGAMAACVMMFATIPWIGFSLFPKADVPYFLVRIEAPEGSSLLTTDRAVREVAAIMQQKPEVKDVMENTGRSNPQIYYNALPREADTRFGELFVTLKEFSPSETPALVEQLRQELSRYPSARVTVEQFEQGPPIDAPIAIRVSGPELSELKRLSAQFADTLRQTPGTRDVVDPLAIDRIDLDMAVDPAKAGLLNVAPDAVRRTLRLAISGERASSLRDAEGDSYPVVVRLPFEREVPAALLDQVYVSSLSGASIPLSQLTAPKLEAGPATINRFKLQRLVTITSFVKDGFLASKVNADALERVRKLPLPPGYSISVGGQAEVSERNNNGVGGIAMLAVFGILCVLVLEFGRFREVTVVAGVVPLGLFGGLWALIITGNSLSYLAIIGFIALIGIEIKNSILLVDFTTQLRQQGMELMEAIERAGEIRFLPVLLTSVTAIGGLLPLALSGSPLYAPLAWVIIGGLVSSTLLSRIVIPAMYLLLVRGAPPPEV
ncbi:efflux RND transporter permease subunit [Novosphingobium sp. APW14]|uniref:efflux RND transporter permease subunit n=1 Tax=Novosphingobium sp. APW14 TaxID=3077237 RepID=UPI0028DFF30E|nr:efflux RND transporter permease subunit [Novosphingobium sp. APW14]MDT9012800.1 efflux RND transporter permease subunit [Novosphingobium sp. APW14]